MSSARKQGYFRGGLPGQAHVQSPRPLHVAAAPQGFSGAAAGFADAARGFGEKFLSVLAGEYRAGQEARVQAAAARVQKEFYEYKSEYMQSRRGEDAANALSDFSAKYGELADRALAEFGGAENEIFRDALARELRGRALLAARDGGSYQAKETRAFRDSVWKGMVAEHEELLAQNPLDGEAAAFSARRLADSYEKMNPGLDNTAMRLDIAGRTNESRLKALLAAGEGGDEASLAEAEKLLSGAGLSLPDPAAHGLPNIPSRYKLKLPADVEARARAAARRNGIPEAIYLGLIMQESGGSQKSVSHAGAIGAAQLMPKTARELGVNPHDLDENLEGGARYLARMYNDTQDWTLALAAYNGGPNKIARWRAGRAELKQETREYPSRVLNYAAQAGGFGLSGEQVAAGRERIRKIREANAEAAQRRAEEGQVSSWLEQWRDLPHDAQMANLANAVAGIEDADSRARVFRLARAQLDFDSERQKLNDNAQAAAFLRDARENGLSPLQRAQALADAGLSAGARQIALKSIDQGEIKPGLENGRALFRGKLAIEDGRLDTENSRLAYAIENSLTHSQTEDLLKYRPAAETVSAEQIFSAAKRMGLPEEFLDDRLLQTARKGLSGKVGANMADIEKTVAKLAVAGTTRDGGFLGWYDSADTLLEAERDGSLERWTPDIEEHEIAGLDKTLAANGLKATDKNRRLLKKLNVLDGIFPLPPIEWE